RREMPCLKHQNAVAGAKRVDDGCFPRAGARRRENDDRARGLENRFYTRENFLAELGELRPTVVENRPIHGTKHTIGNIRWAWNLQEMTASMHHVRLPENGSRRSLLNRIRI